MSFWADKQFHQPVCHKTRSLACLTLTEVPSMQVVFLNIFFSNLILNIYLLFSPPFHCYFHKWVQDSGPTCHETSPLACIATFHYFDFFLKCSQIVLNHISRNFSKIVCVNFYPWPTSWCHGACLLHITASIVTHSHFWFQNWIFRHTCIICKYM